MELGPDDLPPPLPDDDGLAEIITNSLMLEIALTRHPLNCLLPEYNWLRARFAADEEGLDSISGVVRKAVTKFLDEHPAADHIRELAMAELEMEAERRKNRDKNRRNRDNPED